MEYSKNGHMAVVFDFGGVLMDWNPRHLYRKFFPNDPEAMERFLDEIDFVGWNKNLDIGYPFAKAVTEHCSRFPQYAELIQAYDTRWDESVSGPIQSTMLVLESLKQAGYPLYGLSNWSAEKFYPVRDRYDFFSWFDAIIVSGEVGVAKPDPRIFRLMLERIGRPAQSCLFIDDSMPNILAARELGFHTIQFQSSAQLRQALVERGIKLPASCDRL